MRKPVDMTRTGFFEESPGNKSMMRLLSFILMWFFIGFNAGYVYGVFQYRIALANSKTIDAAIHLAPLFDINYIILNFVLLIGIFVPKYLQALAEMASKAGIVPLPKTTSQSTSTSTSSTEVKQ